MIKKTLWVAIANCGYNLNSSNFGDKDILDTYSKKKVWFHSKDLKCLKCSKTQGEHTIKITEQK